MATSGAVLRVLSAIMFSPRGGSSHAARAFARGLRSAGCEVVLLSGSRGRPGELGHAPSFYGDVQSVDFDPALAADDPQRYTGSPGTAPLHPSYEDRPGAADVVFAALDDAAFEGHVQAWARELKRARAADADILHLHHLTPLNEAAARVAPAVPVLGHLHGSELLMLERIAAGPPPEWRYADRWAERMRAWARRAERMIVVPQGIQRAARLLDLPPERMTAIPLGVDVELFRPQPIDRPKFWLRVLVDEPRGWRPERPPGSARYTAADVERLVAGPILIYVGRFTAVKRLDLLLAAFAEARGLAAKPASLVLVGGHPGELEGEHPEVISHRVAAAPMFLAGWHDHDQLARFYAASDLLVTASQREQFGLTLIEAMACQVPVVAARSLGPAAIVEPGRTGWLVPPDDRAALARAMAEAVDNAPERARRGELARTAVIEHYSWPSVVEQLLELMRDVSAARAGQPASPRGECDLPAQTSA